MTMNLTNEKSLARLFLESYQDLTPRERDVLIETIAFEQKSLSTTITAGLLPKSDFAVDTDCTTAV